MFHALVCVVFLGGVCLCTPGAEPARDKKWQEAELKKLQGRWAECQVKDPDWRARNMRLILEIEGSELRMYYEEEKFGGKTNDLTVKVIAVEQADGAGRLILGRKDMQECIVYYDFQGDTMILVGKWPPKKGQLAGYALSGEYKRVKNRE